MKTFIKTVLNFFYSVDYTYVSKASDLADLENRVAFINSDASKVNSILITNLSAAR